ncbi:MAG: helix-turn-helix transcriptional regulator [Tissierella sp.]|nr:helix-turn-helix transcriptional regulator [Tissierella sp.]
MPVFDEIIETTYLGGVVLFYNLNLFGKRLREIRNTLKLKQIYITEVTGIGDKTIRRIESGKVLPKLDTLEILSSVYKEDLVSLLIEYRLDDYSVFLEIKNKIELKLDNEIQHTLNIELKELNILLASVKNSYYKNLIHQLILFTEAIILYKNKSYNNNEVLDKFVKALKITTPLFDLDDFNLFVYSSMEIRVLMNIAFVFNRLKDKEKYLEIMEFCVKSVDTDEEIYPKLCHNLAGAYTRNKEFEKALDYSIMGIKSCQENRNFNGLSLLYYGKGNSEYRLNKEEYMESFKTSIYLCKAFGQPSLEKAIIDKCKKFFDIDL